MKSGPSSICVLLMLAAASAGCYELTDPMAPAGPSPLAFNRGEFVNVQPPDVAAVRVTDATCATGASFVAPFTLVVGPATSSTLTLVDVRVDFMDSQGLQLPSTTFGPTALQRQFGQLTVPKFSTRSFDLRFETGCIARSTGTLTVHVTTNDSVGTAWFSTATLHVK